MQKFHGIGRCRSLSCSHLTKLGCDILGDVTRKAESDCISLGYANSHELSPKAYTYDNKVKSIPGQDELR